MANKLQRAHSSKYQGVYQYISDTRKQRNGKPDICYYAIYKKPDGRNKTEKVGWASEGYTPEVAVEIRAQRVKTARHGKTVRTAKEIQRDAIQRDRTLDEIKTAYFDSQRGQALKGRVTDLNRYERHLQKPFGKKRISGISQLDIERIKRDMKQHAPGTVANTLELLRRLISYGAKNGLCSSLPFTIELPKVNNARTEYLTPEQAKRFLEVLESWPRQDVSRMLKLAMFSGMRRGEIFRLKVADLDFHQALIWLRNPKGGKDVSIPMSGPVRELLQQQLAWCEETGHDSAYVFPAHHDGRRTDSTAVQRIKEKANLPADFRIFHGLRHHLGVTLANSGEYTLDMIGELLTHKSVAVTRRYAQFLPATKRKASDRAAELIQQGAAAKGDGKVTRIKGGRGND